MEFRIADGERLFNTLRRRTLVLDGAMGTMIQVLGLREEDFRRGLADAPGRQLSGCCDLLNLTSPQIVMKIHRQYLDAGADIITANTFNSNAVSMATYEFSDWALELARAGVRLGRQAVDEFVERNGIPEEERPFVAGTLGPTALSLSRLSREKGISVENMDGSTEFQRMADAFRDQALVMMDEGVDVLLLETVYDALNALAALRGVQEAFCERVESREGEEGGKEGEKDRGGGRPPLWISATLTDEGRLPTGETLKEFVRITEPFAPDIMGLNCGCGPASLIPALQTLSKLTSACLSIHPNAGLPDAGGRYMESPERFTDSLRPLFAASCPTPPPAIIGGCCGSTPAHIRRLSRLAHGHKKS